MFVINDKWRGTGCHLCDKLRGQFGSQHPFTAFDFIGMWATIHCTELACRKQLDFAVGCLVISRLKRRNVHLHTRHDDGRGTRGTVEGVQHPAITGKDKRGNKTVFKNPFKNDSDGIYGMRCCYASSMKRLCCHSRLQRVCRHSVNHTRKIAVCGVFQLVDVVLHKLKEGARGHVDRIRSDRCTLPQITVALFHKAGADACRFCTV